MFKETSEKSHINVIPRSACLNGEVGQGATSLPGGKAGNLVFSLKNKNEILRPSADGLRMTIGNQFFRCLFKIKKSRQRQDFFLISYDCGSFSTDDRRHHYVRRDCLRLHQIHRVRNFRFSDGLHSHPLCGP